MPTSPQRQLSKSTFGLVLLTFMTAGSTACLVPAIKLGADFGFSMIAPLVGFVGMLMVLFISHVVLLQRSRANFRAHIIDAHQHRCQCFACGQTTRPVGPPGRARVGQTPQERFQTSRVMGKAGLALAIMGGIISVLFGTLDILQDDSSMTYMALVPLFLYGGIGLAFFFAYRGGTQQQPEPHPCACRWCGAPTQPVG